jgi:hypothetical protein
MAALGQALGQALEQGVVARASAVTELPLHLAVRCAAVIRPAIVAAVGGSLSNVTTVSVTYGA